MIFASLFFLYLFLPLNLLIYYAVFRRPVYRNFVLIFFSLFFYAWGEPVWIVLLLFSASIDYLHGRFIERHRGTSLAKWGVISSLVLNLSILFLFKYSGFVVESINMLLGLSFPVPAFRLPVGISFYTFQTISYVIDVYRGDVKAEKSYFGYLMYLSLYFQLVAGPIVRYKTIADQITSRHVSFQDFSDGLFRLTVGLGKKVILANTAGALGALYLDGDLSKLSVAGAWFGAILYTLQIYFDFSGYSDMAIGLGRMFGFTFSENFRYPYLAKSATDFWRRWHISLGSFFRDYLYIPLGGNRRHQFGNLFIVWFCTGLWHGASWNFVLWGLFYGLLITLEKAFLGRWLEKIPALFSHLYLLLAVVFGWVLFYFTDFTRLFTYLQVMFGFAGAPLWDMNLQLHLLNNLFWLIAAILCCLPIFPALGKLAQRHPPVATAGALARTVLSAALLLISSTMLVGQSYNPFLYYRF